MPRTKSKKRANKRQVNNILSTVQKMEMELLKTPSKLAAQLDKEINTQKKKENKLTKAFNKAQNKVNSAETRMKAAENAKSPAAGKKQLKIAKKIYSEAADAHADLNKQLQTVNSTLAALLDKQSKFNSLSKHLNQFNKDWSKSAKKAKVKPAAQAKKTKKSKKHESNTVEQLHIQPTDDTMEDSRLEEVTELAS